MHPKKAFFLFIILFSPAWLLVAIGASGVDFPVGTPPIIPTWSIIMFCIAGIIILVAFYVIIRYMRCPSCNRSLRAPIRPYCWHCGANINDVFRKKRIYGKTVKH